MRVRESESATLVYTFNGRKTVYSSYVINCIARWRKLRDDPRATEHRLRLNSGSAYDPEKWHDPAIIEIVRNR